MALGCVLYAASPAMAVEALLSNGTQLDWTITLNNATGFAPDGPVAVPSNRLDGQSELTLTRGGAGFDVAIDGFADTQAGALTARLAQLNEAQPAYNAPYVLPKTIHGLTELGRADIHADTQILGADVHLLLGRSVLLWGESLFFPDNAIAGTQAAIDTPRAAADPLLDEKDVFLPAAQASADIGLTKAVSLQAYWQPEWRPDRFSDQTGDLLLPISMGRYAYLPRGKDVSGTGLDQFGVALRAQTALGDFGLYAVRYDAKTPAAIIAPGPYPESHGSYRWAYASGIQSYGASFNTDSGQGNVAGEISYRQRAPLLGYASDAMPAGDTIHVDLSTAGGLPPCPWWNSNSVALELAGNELLGVASPKTTLASKSSRFALAAEAQVYPQYYHLWRGIDLAVPAGISLGLVGHSAEDAAMQGGGAVMAGLILSRRGFRVSAWLRYRIGPLSLPGTGREMVFLGVQESF